MVIVVMVVVGRRKEMQVGSKVGRMVRSLKRRKTNSSCLGRVVMQVVGEEMGRNKRGGLLEKKKKLGAFLALHLKIAFLVIINK